MEATGPAKGFISQCWQPLEPFSLSRPSTGLPLALQRKFELVLCLTTGLGHGFSCPPALLVLRPLVPRLESTPPAPCSQAFKLYNLLSWVFNLQTANCGTSQCPLSCKPMLYNKSLSSFSGEFPSLF